MGTSCLQEPILLLVKRANCGYRKQAEANQNDQALESPSTITSESTLRPDQ